MIGHCLSTLSLEIKIFIPEFSENIVKALTNRSNKNGRLARNINILFF